MTHPSTLTLHRMRYGELDADQIRALEAHLATCDACRGRVQVQNNNRAAFELAPVPAAIRAARKPPGAAWRWAGFLLPAAGLAAALMLLPVTGDGADALSQVGAPAALEETRAKGPGGALEVWLEDGDEAFKLSEGAPVRSGDRVQLRTKSSGGWVSFAGVDTSGQVEVYTVLQVSGGGWQAAPFSLTLDDAPGEQHFYAVFTATRPDRQRVANALKNGKTPRDMKFEHVTLVKAH